MRVFSPAGPKSSLGNNCTTQGLVGGAGSAGSAIETSCEPTAGLLCALSARPRGKMIAITTSHLEASLPGMFRNMRSAPSAKAAESFRSSAFVLVRYEANHCLQPVNSIPLGYLQPNLSIQTRGEDRVQNKLTAGGTGLPTNSLFLVFGSWLREIGGRWHAASGGKRASVSGWLGCSNGGSQFGNDEFLNNIGDGGCANSHQGVIDRHLYFFSIL